MRTLPRLLSDTGQKKTPDKKDGRRMSFQRPKGTIEYSVSESLIAFSVPSVCMCMCFCLVERLVPIHALCILMLLSVFVYT